MLKTPKSDSDQFHPQSRQEWRQWLQDNHAQKQGVWVVVKHKSSPVSGVNYNEAVEEAIAFGWIDSTAHKNDAHSSLNYMTRRHPQSTWSRINRERAQKMIEQGLMSEAGQKIINLAKQTGRWTAQDESQNLEIPPDLQKALEVNPVAQANFSAFPPSSRKMYLAWIAEAKRAETRQRRIAEMVRLALEKRLTRGREAHV
jgi:uncharacterized protein YdeI (YjbR/CyaY-like superfamily)